MEHINDPSEEYFTLFVEAGLGFDDGGTSVDGKHPKGGLSHELPLPVYQGMKSGPEDFHTPADGAAYNKFVLHGDSISR